VQASYSYLDEDDEALQVTGSDDEQIQQYADAYDEELAEFGASYDDEDDELKIESGNSTKGKGKFCVHERKACYCEGTLYFGAGNKWKYQKAKGSTKTMCDVAQFQDPWVGKEKECLCDGNIGGAHNKNAKSKSVPKHDSKKAKSKSKPKNSGLAAKANHAKFCSKERSTCDCEGTIYFGAGDKWHSLKSDGKKATSCFDPTFGDPWVGKEKECRCDGKIITHNKKAKSVPKHSGLVSKEKGKFCTK
jgi:hypothetical protein